MIPAAEAKNASPKAVPVLDLVANGYFKLLGKGAITKPVIVKARFVSRVAEKKIKDAGGAIVLVN